MSRSRVVISAAVALVVIAVIVAGVAAAGGGGEEATTSPPPAAAPPQPAGLQLPPQFLECLADQGIEVDPSTADLHSLPPQALQACFGSLHGGGGAP
jgi:hypothetical protein